MALNLKQIIANVKYLYLEALFYQIWNVYLFYPLEQYHVNYAQNYSHALQYLLDCQNNLYYIIKYYNSCDLTISLIIMGLIDCNYYSIPFFQLQKNQKKLTYLYQSILNNTDKVFYFEVVLRIIISCYISDLYIEFDDNTIIELLKLLFDISNHTNNAWYITFNHIYKNIEKKLYIKYIKRIPLIFYQSFVFVYDKIKKRQENMIEYKDNYERLQQVPSSNDISESTLGRFKHKYKKMGNGHYRTREQATLSILNSSCNYLNSVDFVCKLDDAKKQKAFEYIFNKCTIREINLQLNMENYDSMKKFAILQENEANKNKRKMQIDNHVEINSTEQLNEQLEKYTDDKSKIKYLKEEITLRKKLNKKYNYVHDMQVTKKTLEDLILIMENCFVHEKNINKQEIDNNNNNNNDELEIDDPPLKKRKINTNLYCLCKTSYDGSDMISCDGGCGDWYHLNCVGVSKNEFNIIARTNKKWICPLCK